jgi:hypothetical protein
MDAGKPFALQTAGGFMRFLLFISIAAVAACGPGAGESHNSSQAGATAARDVARPELQPAVTLQGCLTNADRPSDSPADGTRGTGGGSAAHATDQMAAGRGALGERFTLTKAKSESPDSNPSAGSYILDGNLPALRAHVGQQVRVQGALDAAAANTAGPQRIRVTSVDPLGTACAP